MKTKTMKNLCTALAVSFLASASFSFSLLTSAAGTAALGSAFVGGAASLYGAAYMHLFSPKEGWDFNVCQLKKKHLHLNPVRENYWVKLFQPLADHFWQSSHAPLCIDDLELEEAMPPTIAADLLRQTGFETKVNYVVERIPASVARYFGIPSTVEELCSKTDTYIVPMLKETSWYSSMVVEKEPVQLPPARASLSFQEFVHWSVDYFYDTYGHHISASFQSLYQDSILKAGYQFAMFANRANVVWTSFSEDWLTQMMMTTHHTQAILFKFSGVIQMEAAKATNNILGGLMTLRQTSPSSVVQHILWSIGTFLRCCILFLGYATQLSMWFCGAVGSIMWGYTAAAFGYFLCTEWGLVIFINIVVCGGCGCFYIFVIRPMDKEFEEYVRESQERARHQHDAADQQPAEEESAEDQRPPPPPQDEAPPQQEQPEQQEQPQPEQQQQPAWQPQPGDHDLYAIFGVAHDATETQIRRAYYAIMRGHHPDRNRTAGATASSQDINQAYTILNDPRLRLVYDLHGFEAALAAERGQN